MAVPLLSALVGEVCQARGIVDTLTRAAQQAWGSHPLPLPLLLFDCCIMIRDSLSLFPAMVGDHSEGYGRCHRRERIFNILHRDNETAQSGPRRL